MTGWLLAAAALAYAIGLAIIISWPAKQLVELQWRDMLPKDDGPRFRFCECCNDLIEADSDCPRCFSEVLSPLDLNDFAQAAARHFFEHLTNPPAIVSFEAGRIDPPGTAEKYVRDFEATYDQMTHGELAHEAIPERDPLLAMG